MSLTQQKRFQGFLLSVMDFRSLSWGLGYADTGDDLLL